MKHTPAHYAEALFEALKDKSEQDQVLVLKRFKHLIRKNGDLKLLNGILTRYEKIFLKKNGLKKVEVASASLLAEKTKKEIEKVFNAKVLLTEKVDEKLLAGLTILVDDTIFIDASGLSRINKLFV